MEQIYPEYSLDLTPNRDLTNDHPLLQLQPNNRQNILGKAKGCVESFQDKFNPGSLMSSMFTLIMATFGTGVLVLPASIAESGLVWAMIQLVICAWLGYYSLMTVVICAIKAKVCSYQELADKTYGKWFRLVVNVVLFFGNLGTIVLYLKMMASLMLNFILSFASQEEAASWLESGQEAMKITTAVMTLVFIIPISLTKQLRNLRYICLVSFFFVVFLCCVVFFEKFFFEPPPPEDDKGVRIFDFGGASITFPTAIFTFMCHSNVLDVYGELNIPSRRRMRKVVRGTMSTVLICCTIVGIFGYITFANNLSIFDVRDVGGVVLYAYAYDENENFTSPPTAIRMCLIMMCMALIVATPINVIPAKDAIKEVFFPKRTDRFGDPFDENDSYLSHFLFVTSTVIGAALLAIFPQASVQNLMNTIASSLYTLICFVFPPIFHLKLNQDKPMNKRKVLNWSILVIMTGVGIWMTEANVTLLVSGQQ